MNRLISLLSITLLLTLGGLSSPAQAWFWQSADEKANTLFVEAKTQWMEYEKIEGDDLSQLEARLTLLEQVDASLDEIISEYPQSNIAVELVSGPTGGLDITEVERLISVYESSISAISLVEEAESIWASYRLVSGSYKGDFERRLNFLESFTLAANLIRTEYPESIFVTDGYFDTTLAEADNSSSELNCYLFENYACFFEESLSYARGLEDAFEEAYLTGTIARAQARAGLNFEAIETAQRIGQPTNRASALIGVAGIIHDNDLSGIATIALSHAIKSSEIITDKSLAVNMLLGIAEEFHRMGFNDFAKENVSTALDLTDRIYGSENKAGTLFKISVVQAKLGLTASARQSRRVAKQELRNVTDPNTAAIHLFMHVYDLAEAGFIDLAMETNALITEDEWRVSSLMEIAQAQVQVGDIAGANDSNTAAFALAMNLPNPDGKLITLAEIQASSGDVVGALNIAQNITSDQIQQQALRDIAKETAMDGDIYTALDLAQSIDSPIIKSQTLTKIIEAQVLSGETLDAFTTIADALEVTGSDSSAVSTLSTIAIQQHKLGDQEGAEQTLNRARTVAKRHRNQIGHHRRVLELAKASSSIGDRIGARGSFIDSLELVRQMATYRLRRTAIEDIFQEFESINP